ncbi:MAG: SIS domain-containing protein [Thermoplasmatales archaeon]|nr:MAG: SIS domain-containing protein [Thermoplasmatales archaeon]
MKNEKQIEQYFEEIKEICDKVSREDIDKVIELLFDAWRNGNQVFFCGNGGSAGTATHFMCDLFKVTVVEGKKRFRATCLNDNIPLMTALINDEGFENLFVEQLKNLFEKGDVLICLSVHGGSGKDKAGLWSQNLLKAMNYVKKNSGKTIGFSGFDGGVMKKMADICIVVPFNATPHVEAFHVVLQHLIAFRLKEKIDKYKD